MRTWTLFEQLLQLCFTSQTLGEFWNASTRPLDKNGFGLSVAVAHQVKGVQVHDARLAASMYVHGVTQLLTVNVRDFQRFTGLRVVHPAEVVHPAQQT
ncbi:MAG TPA: hypothetical protein VE959_02915 [Bryobacteraceae bacterium]|nr:hypothetical protein [Bryobacteraceae bacterium]